MLIAKIYILRHGETAENRAHIIQGQRDTLLNDAGRKQAAMAVDFFKEVELDWALTSDLRRAVETTEIILADHPRREQIRLVKETNLRERALGVLEGKHLSERRKQIEAGATDETAESPEAFRERALAWWDTQIIQDLTVPETSARNPNHVLVVSHGGFISTLVRNLLSSGRVKARSEVTDWVCFNVSITTIEVFQEGERRKASLVRYSDTSHLKVEDLVQYNADVLKSAGL